VPWVFRPPLADVAVPEAVTSIADGQDMALVWASEVGGLTFAIGAGPGRRFIKWAPDGSGLDLEAEADRMVWAGCSRRARI
jgi:aminoglycoside phosphotransferase